MFKNIEQEKAIHFLGTIVSAHGTNVKINFYSKKESKKNNRPVYYTMKITNFLLAILNDFNTSIDWVSTCGIETSLDIKEVSHRLYGQFDTAIIKNGNYLNISDIQKNYFTNDLI